MSRSNARLHRTRRVVVGLTMATVLPFTMAACAEDEPAVEEEIVEEEPLEEEPLEEDE